MIFLVIRLIRAVKQLLTKDQFQYAHGRRHIGDMWESFLVPCLQQEDTLIPYTLDAVVSIWSQSLPKEMTSKHQFHDTEQALMRAIEKILSKRSGKEEEEVLTDEGCDQEKLEEERRFKEFMQKATAPPLDAPIDDPIRVKCLGMIRSQTYGAFWYTLYGTGFLVKFNYFMNSLRHGHNENLLQDSWGSLLMVAEIMCRPPRVIS